MITANKSAVVKKAIISKSPQKATMSRRLSIAAITSATYAEIMRKRFIKVVTQIIFFIIRTSSRVQGMRFAVEGIARVSRKSDFLFQCYHDLPKNPFPGRSGKIRFESVLLS